MIIKRNTHKTNAEAPHLPEGNFLAKRIGFWGIVKEVNSINNTVTVISDTGFEFPNIQVMSDEWVTVDDSKDYIPSTRNLPPKNSRVFVLTPTYSAVGAFVLCSGFSRGDENIRTLWASGDSELEDKNNCRETKTQGGWDITEEYENGNFKAASHKDNNDKDIQITLNPVADNQKSQPKEVSIKAWGNEIIITEDEISISDSNGSIIDMTSSGFSITDKNHNSFVSEQNKYTITVGNSTVEVSNTKVTINGHLEVSV